ncbi:MAG: hypothetical protein KTU85_06385 [Acidimicrobiia bacterium]|nr:hypothetical protein [Acidimicrobiia bacterium]MCY4457781.1 hypothetical protein [Acidimicrobiaceae bacterium]
MARLNHEALCDSVAKAVGAAPDPSGEADLLFDKGKIIVAAQVADLKTAFKRVKKINGYRWVAINREDLFGANPLSLGSKAGILDANGKVLKAADIPRKKV